MDTFAEKATGQKNNKLLFNRLPAFARFIREYHLIDYIKEQLHLSRAIDLPMLKFLAQFTDEQLIEMGLPAHTDFLVHAEENRLYEKLQESLKTWEDDQIGLLGREDLTIEDITASTYIRKQAFLKIIPLYSSDPFEIIELIKELDVYEKEANTGAANTYVNILKQRLQKSEALYKEAQAMNLMGNWEWNFQTNEISWSDEVYNIFEIPKDKPLELDYIKSFVHPDDISIINKSSQDLEALKNYEVHYRIVLPGNRIKYINSKARIAETAEGKPLKIIGALQDVTERQMLIAELQEKEMLYKQAQAMSHIGNWEWLVDDNTVIWSDEMYRIYGLDRTQEPISYEQYTAMLHPDDAGLMLDAINNCLQKHQPYERMHRIILPGGKIKYLLGKGDVMLNKDGKVIKLFGTSQDITKEYLAEKRVHESRAFIQKITDTTPSLIASYNINTGQYSFINDALKTLLGYEPRTVYDKGIAFFMDILHPEDMAVITEKNSEAIAEANNNVPEDGKEPIAAFKYRLKNSEGEYRWFQTFGTVFSRDKDGKVEEVLNVSIDITSQENAEQALQQKNMQLLQSNASLEEYAYVASHDLKEPLRKISIFADRLQQLHAANMNDDGRRYVDKIIDASKRMQALINDLLTISTLSGDAETEMCSLKEIFDETIKTLEYKIEEKQAAITCNDLPEIKIVVSQFRRLFQNLISNSLKFSREGVKPEIQVTCKYLSGAEVKQFHLPKAKRYLQIDFSDNGIGFNNEYKNRIFTIFQKLHGRSEYEGTGIGLAICKKIAENHGGIIFADGKPGEGAIFTVIIPA